MVVHGGIGDSGKTLNETIFLEFNNLKWNKLDNRGTRSPYLSSHCSEFVLENERAYNNSYHIYRGSNLIENSNIIKKIEYEGIYIFGGIDEEGIFKNDVFVLRVGRKPCEWIHLKIRGNPPLPRASAKLNFTFLIIFQNFLFVNLWREIIVRIQTRQGETDKQMTVGGKRGWGSHLALHGSSGG